MAWVRQWGKQWLLCWEKLRNWELLCPSGEGSRKTSALPQICAWAQEELPGLWEGYCKGIDVLEGLYLRAGWGELLLPKPASSPRFPSSTTAQN